MAGRRISPQPDQGRTLPKPRSERVHGVDGQVIDVAADARTLAAAAARPLVRSALIEAEQLLKMGASSREFYEDEYAALRFAARGLMDAPLLNMLENQTGESFIQVLKSALKDPAFKSQKEKGTDLSDEETQIALRHQAAMLEAPPVQQNRLTEEETKKRFLELFDKSLEKLPEHVKRFVTLTFHETPSGIDAEIHVPGTLKLIPK